MPMRSRSFIAVRNSPSLKASAARRTSVAPPVFGSNDRTLPFRRFDIFNLPANQCGENTVHLVGQRVGELKDQLRGALHVQRLERDEGELPIPPAERAV